MYKDKIPVGKAEDLKGKVFGKLIVLYRTLPTAKNREAYWKCQCECGNFYTVPASRLKNGRTQSCGCYRAQMTSANKTIDITGKRFGYLVAIKPTDKLSGTSKIWECQCDCGNICYVASNALRSKRTQSCGCLQKERTSKANFIDITNKKFGKLTALYPIDKGECNGSISWFCKCDCGNTHIVQGSLLRSGLSQSCGCITSYGEELIARICRENNLNYEQQKMFDSCRFEDTGKKARFDFFINNSYLIEFDGIQHFICSNKDWNTEEAFQNTQKRDKYKNQWCKENNIPLIRIPYTKLDTLCIKDLLLETTQFKIN